MRTGLFFDCEHRLRRLWLGSVDCGEELMYIMNSAGVMFGFLLLSATLAAQQYVISTYAGGARPPTPALGVAVPFGARFGDRWTRHVTCTPQPELCFQAGSERGPQRVAGNSRAGYSGDGGPGQARNWAHSWA